MKPSLNIPLYRTFLNWIIAVITGSILWPMVYWLFDHKEIRVDDAGGIMLISMVLSGLFSLPAMLIMLFAGWQLNKQQLIPSAYVRIHVAIHLMVALLTFFIIYVFVNRGLGNDGFGFIVLAATYTIVGLTTWSTTFWMYKKKLKYGHFQQTELLDDASN